MKIQSIEKYKGQTYCITFTDERRLYLNGETLREFNLREEMELPLSAVREIKRTADLRRARERALYLLTARDHSCKELFDKLAKNYPEDICREICEKMDELGFLDDERYAGKVARELCVVRALGYYRARFEMQKKGLPRELIDEALEAYQDGTRERLYELVERRYARHLTDYKGIQRVKSALARLGYSFDDINEVLAEFDEE